MQERGDRKEGRKEGKKERREEGIGRNRKEWGRRAATILASRPFHSNLGDTYYCAPLGTCSALWGKCFVLWDICCVSCNNTCCVCVVQCVCGVRRHALCCKIGCYASAGQLKNVVWPTSRQLCVSEQSLCFLEYTYVVPCRKHFGYCGTFACFLLRSTAFCMTRSKSSCDHRWCCMLCFARPCTCCTHSINTRYHIGFPDLHIMFLL